VPVAAAVNVTLDVDETLWLTGLVVTLGAKLTVSVAAVVVALPLALVKTARYLLPFWLENVLKLSVVLVAPAMFWNDAPPSMLCCHCTVGVGAPLAAAEKLTV